MNCKLVVGWLYPELMSTYGDRGNIIALKKRCEWRGIDTEIIQMNIGFSIENLKKCDFIFMGGAQDKQQQIVSSDLNKEKIKALKEMIDKGIPGLYICGAYQFLGKYYKEADGSKILGLSILDIYTENPGEKYERLIGNILVEFNGFQLVGFENHGGRTRLGNDVKPLGKVISGFGNNEKDKTEGAIYKNSFGTYLHGPILPKNPMFTDYLIKLALKRKYNSPIEFSPLDDSIENKAHDTIANKLIVGL